MGGPVGRIRFHIFFFNRFRTFLLHEVSLVENVDKKNFSLTCFYTLVHLPYLAANSKKKYCKNHYTYRFHSVFSELFDYIRCEQQKTLIKKFWFDMILYLGTFAIFGSIYPKKYISRTVAPTDLIFPLQNFLTICDSLHR